MPTGKHKVITIIKSNCNNTELVLVVHKQAIPFVQTFVLTPAIAAPEERQKERENKSRV